MMKIITSTLSELRSIREYDRLHKPETLRQKPSILILSTGKKTLTLLHNCGSGQVFCSTRRGRRRDIDVCILKDRIKLDKLLFGPVIDDPVRLALSKLEPRQPSIQVE